MIYSFPSGSYYEGDMVDDCFQGQGSFYFANGDLYKGEFQNDMFEGYGEYRYKSGSIYKGFFSKDMFHGIGTFSYQDESIEKGKFHQEKRVGKFYKFDNLSKEYREVLYQNDISIKSECANPENVHEDKLPVSHILL